MAQINEKLLTIAIPTYNRSHYLKECLDHICPQLDNRVELIVRDNCSNNYDFEYFIKPYKERYGIVTFQNIVNVGSDGNTAKLFEYCKTKWLWILGDDDYVTQNAVELVLSTIQANEDSVFVMFNSPIEGCYKGLKGFAEAMKPKGAFGHSFFISEGIHNVERTKGLMYWHYRYISTYITQILRVMWHLANNEGDQCLFLKNKILEEQGRNTTWIPIEIVPYQALVFDIFRPYRKILLDNVFRDIVRYCWVFISKSSLSFSDKCFYYKLFLHKYGILNTIRYNSVDILIAWFSPLLGKNIKNVLKKRLNLNSYV